MNLKSIHSKFSESKKRTSIGTFLFLFLLMVVLPCTIITFYANKLITQKLQLNSENYLSSASVTLDNVFQACTTQADTILKNTSEDFYTLLQAKDLSSPEASLASYHFQMTMNNTYFNQDFFSDAFIYFKNPNLVFTTQGTYNSDTFFQQYRFFESYPQNFFEDLTATSYRSVFCPPTDILTETSDAGKKVYSHAIPVAVNLTGPSPSDAVLILLLDENKLNTVLDQLNTAETSYFYILDTRSGLILNHPSKTDYDRLLNLDKLQYTSRKGTKHTSDNRILWQKSNVNRLTYICVEPKLLITEQLHSFLGLTLATVFVILILCVIIYRWFSTRLHTALLSVFNHLKQSTDDASFPMEMPETIDMSTVINAAELLHQQHESNRPQLIHAFLLHLFHGNTDTAEITDFCNRFHVFPKGDFFRIVSLQTNFYVWEDSSSPAECHTILKKIESQIPQYGYIISLNDKYSFSVLITAPSINELSIKTNGLTHYLKSSTESNIPEAICTQSAIFRDIADARMQYHQTLELFETRGIAKNQFLYSPEDIASSESALFLPEIKNKIRSVIEHHPEECPQYIQTLLDNFLGKNIAFSQYRTFIMELLFLFQELLYEHTISLSSLSFVDEAELTLLSERIITTERLTSMCMLLYTNLTNQLLERRKDSDPAETLLLNYIDEHLKDISLTVLSDAMGMHPNYLSQYFKKHFGISFIDYVTKKKMEKAKEMLIHTSLTCKAIGEELGYHDPNVFTRAFKKFESTTPNEYRRSHKLTSL